jgi:hypothetical protein
VQAALLETQVIKEQQDKQDNPVIQGLQGKAE